MFESVRIMKFQTRLVSGIFGYLAHRVAKKGIKCIIKYNWKRYYTCKAGVP